MDNSPLKRLPLELRLDIYDRVLYAEEGVKVTLNKPIDEESRLSMAEYTSQPHRLAICSTCKEIAKEAADIVFKINDSWTFVHMDDDSIAWGKRLRKWYRDAGENSLKSARNVQFDTGLWDSRPKRHPRGNITRTLHAQIGSMYQNLPKQLRQCEQNFKLRIKWSSGVRLADGSKDRLDVVTLVLPLWGKDPNIQACMLDAASQVRESIRKYDITWHMGSVDGEVPAFVDPPDYNKQLARKIGPEKNTLLMLASDIGLATAITFQGIMRGRLEEFAVDT